jgi:hypothetical protein
MAGRLEEIVAKKELLRSRCELDRLEARAAWLDLRQGRPFREAGRVFLGPPVRSRLLELTAIAVGSTRLHRLARLIARGVLLWKIVSVARAFIGPARPERAAASGPGDAGSAGGTSTAATSAPVGGAAPPLVSASGGGAAAVNPVRDPST